VLDAREQRLHGKRAGRVPAQLMGMKGFAPFLHCPSGFA
jgi:hypothetical protein